MKELKLKKELEQLKSIQKMKEEKYKKEINELKPRKNIN